ncbi:flagellar M-ring protein FliF [Granulicella pectinivorans]|uniref:Flagellar M-ring protein n=1 Tax=Granulicella pectinivorans TaxID=474950 RepID=A0A1I6MNS4_9BACT|nr:flagellar basal-body MS-ring/collar protein FliF [Granulicella pectinivorans]SFS17353.1 flagellar M-ring protein FliF [Granulicella pectinivorans]
MADPKQPAGTELARTAPATATQALAAMHQVRDRLMALPPRRRNLLLGGMLFVLAGCAALTWFWQRPDWRVLFSGLDARDVQTVSSELAGAGIPFQTTPDGSSLQVPADALDKARMEVAAKGMPQTGRLGFELFDKPNWVGSEFDERVNYQRALEGELEHTIASLGVIHSARVHLVLPQQTLFASQDKIAKASVVLKLRRASLTPEQIDAIRSLVASAVENLSPDNVTLVDAEGRQNLQAKGRGSAAHADMEQALEAKLIAMLEPLAGRENVRATVNIAYDDTTVERTDEVYDPAQSATLTMRKTEQISAPRPIPTGIPGTASNTPAAAPAASAQAAGAAAAAGTPPLLKEAAPVYPTAAAGASQTSTEEQGTYGVTRHVVHTEEGAGRIRRVTAAVVVNDRQITEGAGKTQHVTWKPRSPDEMKHLEQLAQAAVGFDERRGDQVVMSNVGFHANVPDIPLAPMAKLLEESRSFLAQQPSLLRTAMMGLIAFCVVLFVLRPVANQISAALKAPVLLPAGSPTGTTEVEPNALAEGTATPSLPTPEPHHATIGLPVLPIKSRTTLQAQAIFDHVSRQIAREPAQSTRLLEVWLGAQEGDA